MLHRGAEEVRLHGEDPDADADRIRLRLLVLQAVRPWPLLPDQLREALVAKDRVRAHWRLAGLEQG